jgi:hypothetical protein
MTPAREMRCTFRVKLQQSVFAAFVVFLPVSSFAQKTPETIMHVVGSLTVKGDQHTVDTPGIGISYCSSGDYGVVTCSTIPPIGTHYSWTDEFVYVNAVVSAPSVVHILLQGPATLDAGDYYADWHNLRIGSAIRVYIHEKGRGEKIFKLKYKIVELLPEPPGGHCSTECRQQFAAEMTSKDSSGYTYHTEGVDSQVLVISSALFTLAEERRLVLERLFLYHLSAIPTLCSEGFDLVILTDGTTARTSSYSLPCRTE